MTPKEVLGKVLGRPQEVFLAPREYVLRLGKWFGVTKCHFGDSTCMFDRSPIDPGFKDGKMTKC
jgi:hypothetical protein